MHIRLARQDDARACLDIYRPIVSGTAISFETLVPDEDTYAGRIQSYLTFAPWLVAAEGEEVLGFAYGSRFRPRPAYQWSVEVTVYVAESARNRGVGKALYGTLLAALRAQGFVNAYALITLPNSGSVALHETMGFRKLGVLDQVGFKLGVWHDVGWWRNSLCQPPPAPNPLGKVEDAVAVALAGPPG